MSRSYLRQSAQSTDRRFVIFASAGGVGGRATKFAAGRPGGQLFFSADVA